ncbi:mucin-4 isoform X5 [Gallus gallus]|uniref:mucin-4 isoform X5 n=1 Tax=Gallus gallus TaxID=9031 RepID=UPI001AE484E1|nr:mucin-4 isoform X5 [Gallus gallus]
MGTRGWMLPTLMGCCLWILHGLGTAAAVPVTTEGPFAATPSQGEAPTALLLGTVGTSTVNDTVMAESILVSPTMSPSSPSWAEPDSVTETTGYNSPLGAERDAELSAGEVTQAPTGDPQAGTDVATSLDETQKYQSGSAAAKAAAISVTPQPNFTPSTKHNVTGTTAAAPLGSTPVFADVPAPTTRAGAGLESTADATFLLSATITTAAGTQAMTTTPLRPGLTALPPDAGAEVEDVTLPGDGQGDGSAPSAMPSPGARGLLPTPSGEVVSGTVGDTPGWAALKSGDVGDAAHGVFSTADLPQLPPENVTALGAAENPGQNSLLTSQAGPSPANLLGPGDGDRQGDPAVLPSSPGSALAQSEAPTAPGVRGDTATLLPATDVQSDADVPAPDTGVPLPTGAVDLAEGSLQPAPWLSPIGEEQPLLGADPPVPTDTSGAPSTAFPPPGVAAGSLPATDDGTEAVVSPDFSADLGVSLSSPLEGSQPWGTAADGASTSLNSALGATNPSSSAPDGTALPAAGQQAQGDTGAGDTTQAEDAGDGSPYENTQSDTSSAASSTQQGPADSAPGAVLYTNLSPAADPGEGALAPALSPDGPAAPSQDLSGAGGAEPLPIETPGAPGAALPPPAAVDGTVFGPDDGAEAAVSPDLSAAPEAPVSPSLGASQPWDAAAGAPQDTALPGAEGPGTGINSVLDAPSPAVYGPVGPPSPSFGVQPGTGMGMPGVDGPDTSLSSALGATNPSLSPPDGAAFPAAGQQAQGDTGAGDTTQAEDAGDGSPYENTQSDMSSATSSTQQGPADSAPGAVLYTNLSPAADPGEGALAPALSSDGPAAPSQDLSGAGGAEPLPIETPGAPGAALPPPAAVDGTVFAADNGAEAAVSPDLSGAPEAPVSPSLGASQPWDTAAGAPQDTALPGAEGPGTGINSVLDAPSPAVYGPVGPPSPSFGVQPGAGVGMPGVDGPDTSLSSALGATNPSSFAPDGAALPPPVAVDGAVFEANNGAEAAVSPDLSAAPEAPVSPSLGVLQPWDTAAGAPQDTALPGAEGPGSGFSSALNAPSLASYGPIGPPSPDLAEQPGTGLTVLGAEGQEPGGLSSAAAFEPSLSSSPDTGLKAGMDLLPGALSPSGPASPSDVLTAPSASDTAGPSGLGGAGGAPGALQPSLGAAPGLRPSAGVRDGPEAVSADGEAPGQSQDQAGTGAAAASDGRPGATLHSISSSPLADGSSSPEAAAGADTGAGIPRAGEVGSSSGLGAAAFQGNKETPILLPSIQSSASVSPPGAKLSQANVVELVGGKLGISAQEAPTASGGNGVGTVTQIASGVLPPSIPTSPRETQPLVPVAPAASIPLLVSETASARGVGDSSVPNMGPSSASSTQSGSNPPVLPWSPVDEMASGMLASLGEELQRAPNAAPAPPSASERENLKEGAAASPQISSPVPATLGQLAAALALPPLPAVPAVPLYGYGPRENDHEYVQRRADFNSPLFKPETGFPFGKTLRDSLYFTDNGQIIFPASDSSIFTLPNPPAHRFTGHEGVAMIAVFWDNADFSRGTGTTFYQEFLTLNSEKPPFVRDVEEKVRRYLRSSYSAAWTLKITWEKAPAYGARGDSRRTNTYQAVLTTDGFRSYVLILYQDGGMQWDYTQLLATNVLIGYTSGDGYYRNDDLTQSPPAAKYRPDRYRGYNTDLRGLWLYKLESRVGTNYRLKCLAWMGRQQEPQAWSQDLPACPCSLQQGQQDPRFRSSRGGWGSARVSMLHSSSPNSHGAGVRCLYDGRGQLVEGRQERYWRASRQASPYRDQELKLYDWCCNQAGSAHLCAHYNEKRPRIGCDGYRAPGAEDSSEDSNSEEQRDDDEE